MATTPILKNVFIEIREDGTPVPQKPNLKNIAISWGQPHDPLPTVSTLRNLFISWGNTLEAPIANFMAVNTFVIVDQVVLFLSRSTGQPSSYLWDFGDENLSVEKNPSHTYTTPGLYTVTLNVSNDFGVSTETKEAYITVLRKPNPIFLFTGL